MSKTILVAEDHALINWGYELLFKAHFPDYKLEIVTTAALLEERLKQNEHTYCAAILDLQLLDKNILMMIPEIREKRPNLPLLVVTSFPENVYALQLLKVGVRGFMTKQAGEQAMIEAVSTLLNGGIYISTNIKAQLLQPGSGSNSANPFSDLSIRELEVLKLLLGNKGITEIAQLLGLAPTTIASHKTRILKRLNVDNMQDLYKLATLHQFNPQQV